MSTLIDLTPARVDITVTQGDTLTFISCCEGFGRRAGDADRDGAGSGTPHVQRYTAVSFTVTKAGYVATLTLTAAQTVGDAGDVGVGLRLHHVVTTTIAAGEIRVTPEVRRG
jgi:hypothetical protein